LIEIFFKEIGEVIVPITGFTLMPYFVTLIITVNQLSRNKKLTNYNIGVLAFYILFNSIQSLTIGDDYNDFNNPYLKISPWRPVWTIALPALWILILLSPRIKKYYESLEIDSSK
jgi:hypothetical protein